jgi:hypothetical protein
MPRVLGWAIKHDRDHSIPMILACDSNNSKQKGGTRMNIQDILISILVLSIYFSIYELNHPVVASSPVVPFKYLLQKPTNVRFQITHPGTPFKILSTDYSSDGKTLNATIWLPSYLGTEGLRFGMSVSTGVPFQTSYYAYVQTEHNGSLTNHLIQRIPTISPSENSLQIFNKTLGESHALTGSYVKGNRFLDLSLNLASIGSPSQYFVYFFLAYGNTPLDQTLNIAIPGYCGFDCVILKPPSLTNVVAGGQVHASVTIEPGNATRFLINDFVNVREIYKVSLSSKTTPIKLTSSPVDIPRIVGGNNISDVLVSVPTKMQSGNYSIPINETFTGKSILPSTFTSFKSLQLQVLPAPTISQNVRTFLTNNPLLIILIPVAITTGVVIGILRVIDVNNSGVLKSLSVSDIMQVDGTVIVGVLILLTLSSSATGGFHRTTAIVGVVTSSIVYPFALSAIRVVTKGSIDGGIKLTIAGFVYLMVAVVVLSFIQ